MEPRFLFNENFTFSPNGPYRVRIDGVIYFLLCEFYNIVIVTERSSKKQYYYSCSSRASKPIAIVAVSLGLDFSEIFQVRKDLERPIFLIVSAHKLD